MITRLIRFNKGATPRESYGLLIPIQCGEELMISLVNHDVRMTPKIGQSVEFSGLIEIHSEGICVVTWR